METMFGAGTNVFPYIFAAYGVGAASLFGFAAWTLKERLKLRTLLAEVRKGERR